MQLIVWETLLRLCAKLVYSQKKTQLTSGRWPLNYHTESSYTSVLTTFPNLSFTFVFHSRVLLLIAAVLYSIDIYVIQEVSSSYQYTLVLWQPTAFSKWWHSSCCHDNTWIEMPSNYLTSNTQLCWQQRPENNSEVKMQLYTETTLLKKTKKMTSHSIAFVENIQTSSLWKYPSKEYRVGHAFQLITSEVLLGLSLFLAENKAI